jgi:hypothetical protein
MFRGVYLGKVKAWNSRFTQRTEMTEILIARYKEGLISQQGMNRARIRGIQRWYK